MPFDESPAPKNNDDSKAKKNIEDLIYITLDFKPEPSFENEDHLKGDMGLPEDWQARYIPTEADLTHAAERKLRSLQQKLHEFSDLDQLLALLDDITLTIRAASNLHKLVPLMVEVGLESRPIAQKLGLMNKWSSVLDELFVITFDKVKPRGEYSQYYRRVFAGIMDFFASRQWTTGKPALVVLAFRGGINEPNRSERLAVQASYLNAKVADYSLKTAENRTDLLLKFAAKDNNLFITMRVYIIKAHLYNDRGMYRFGFIYGQQALGVALKLGEARFFSECLSQMITAALWLGLPTPYIENLFKYWETLCPNLFEHVYETGVYLSLQGKYHFDRTRDFEAAAKAFEGAYECQRIQDHKLFQAANLLGGGLALTKLETYEEAAQLLQKACELYRDFGTELEELWAVYSLGWSIGKSGNLREAILLLEDAREMGESLSQTSMWKMIMDALDDDLEKFRSQYKPRD